MQANANCKATENQKIERIIYAARELFQYYSLKISFKNSILLLLMQLMMRIDDQTEHTARQQILCFHDLLFSNANAKQQNNFMFSFYGFFEANEY